MSNRDRYCNARSAASVLALLLVLFLPTAVFAAHCTHCDATLMPDALFCGQCGTRVEASAPAHLYCWQCGVEQPATAKFCSRCGAELDASPARPSPGITNPPAAPPPPTGRRPKNDDRGAWNSTPVSPGTGPGLRLRPREIILPPQVFEAPTGDILPSLTLHLSGGVAFGFSDDRQSETGVLRFGLGGIAEALVSTSNIVHIVDVRSSALLGFRLGVPTALRPRAGKDRLRAALNFAASDDHRISDLGTFTATDGVVVNSLLYTYRETTAGLAATWRQDRARYHAAIHATDLRATNVSYAAVGPRTGRNQRTVHTSFAVAFDYAVNPRTWFLAEMSSVPRIGFRGRTGDLHVASLLQYGLGVRFFPDPLLALDSSLHIDEEAVGLGDVRIGFGIHVLLNPRSLDVQKAPEAASH